MADLIRGLIQVKDPLTLFAFVSLVFLAAFKTKQVPEMFFGLAKEKLTRERFSQLLHRFMLYGFAAFVLLCGTAVVGEVLALKTQAKPISIEDLLAELKQLNVSEDRKQSAATSYSEAMAYVQQKEFDSAIQSLQNSINAVPSLAAQYTLAYLYQKKGDAANARKHAVAARVLAQEQGDSLAQVRLDQLSAAAVAQSEDRTTIGPKTPLPEGGRSLDEAVPLAPGLYGLTSEMGSKVYRYYKMRVKAGHSLIVDLRTSDTGIYAAASIYNQAGEIKAGDGIVAGRSQLRTVRWDVPTDMLVYVSIGSEFRTEANTVYKISIQ